MSEAVTDALRALIIAIVNEALPVALAKVAATRDDDELITVDRAKEFHLTKRIVSEAIRRGELANVKCGRKLAVRHADLIAWRNTRTFKPRARATPANDTTLAEDIAADFAAMTARS